MQEAVQQALNMVLSEIGKVIIGKEDVIRKVVMSVLSNGHVLLDDVPGVGKTTLAVTLGKTLGLKYSRIQFTPDILPSDIVGFSIYNKEKEQFVYMPGVVNDTNLLLADEINRTSSRTQAALLEAMEERQVTVDGISHPLQKPFLVIATQNQVGTAGTQLLPQAQLDRFLVRLSIGYPDRDSEKAVILGRQTEDPYTEVRQILNQEILLTLQKMTRNVTLKDTVVSYITDLAIASRESEWIDLGISPRGTIAISHMAKACALISGRDYATVEDVREVFCDVCSHRILLTQKARAEHMTTRDALLKLMDTVPVPFVQN